MKNKQTKICAYINPYSIYEISNVYNVFVVRRASCNIEACAVFSATGVTNEDSLLQYLLARCMCTVRRR